MSRLVKFLAMLALVLISSGLAAQITVTGTVFDEAGESLPGVNIILKGQDKGTITDFDGKFSLPVPNVNSVLVFSYLGYQTVEMKVDRSKPMSVVMKEETKALNEVMVIGYQDVRKRDLTGSVAKANIDDMLKAPVASFDQALAGRIAGVNVSSGEGTPGGVMKIIIRGNNSLTQDNTPLFIIDGFPVEDPAVGSSVNPNDIESIDVLKDASATAIYGARGANGVIIITTKKGSIGEPQISYDGSAGIQRITRKIPMMDAYEFVRLQSEIAPDIISGENGYFKTYEGKTYSLDDYRNVPQYDWQDLIFQDAFQQSHSVSLTGGTAGNRYNASFSYYDQDGVVLASNYNRIQGRLGTTIKKNKLTVNLTTNYSRASQTGSSPSQSSYSGMNNLFYSVWGYRPVTQPGIPLTSLLNNTTDEGVDPTNDYRFNPILSLNNEYRKTITSYTQYNGFLEYELSKGLKLKVSGGYTIDGRRGETFNNSKTRYGSPVSNDKVNATLSTSERKTWLNENILTYQANVDRKHFINALAGITMQESMYDFYSMKTINIPNESLGMAGMSQGTPNDINSILSSWGMMSYLGRFNYNYLSKYYFTASYRIDGSSKFAKRNRYGYFPSASLAWNFTEENFLKEYSYWLSSGKLRLSWGETGNNRVGEYDTYAQLLMLQGAQGNFSGINDITHGIYPFNNNVSSVGAIPGSLPNKDLKWETTTQTNIGMDVSLLKEKISLTFDWYNKITSDLLLNAALVPSSGHGAAMKNIGKVLNRGFEFTVNTTNIQTRKFRWTSNFNIGINKNVVLGLAENQLSMRTNAYFDQNFTSPNYIAKVGYPIGMMYGYIFTGTYKEDDFNSDGANYSLKPGVARYTAENNTQPGYPKYADLNEDGIIDSNDQTFIGRGEPKHVGGFTNNFEYAGFDLSIFFQWSYGANVLNANKLMFETGYNRRRDLNQFASFAGRWTPTNTDSDIPRVSASPSNNLFSTRLIEDGSYLRLKTLSLGYSLPKNVLDKLKLKKARIYVSGQNLFTWTSYSGYDPEVSIRNSALTPGLDFSSYPRAKSVNLGVNVNF
ncbi:MAG: SusC/RagA family TonB-linked outer membrane protein [Paludibacter sp. 47-17]|nr:MAG: SusC/RagA family TonB-linked outer membrane protein [Paludibacter sp. 47-17]